MPDIFGGRWTPDQIAQRVGRLDQVAGARPFVFDGGPARGMRGIDVWTGSGLEFTVLPDRCLDVGAARFAGMALAWESSTGPVRPERYEPQGLGWLRSFGGGLVTTCGLRHFGGPEEDGGETFGLHGRASNLAAEDVAAERAWEGPDYRLRIRGRIAEAEVFKPTLVLERTISTALGSRGLRLDDRVTNAGCQPTSAMLLYHVNLGWPLLAEHSRLVVDAATIEPRTDHAAKDPEAAKKTPGVVSPKGPKGAAQKRHLVSFSQHAAMGPPTAGFEEQVYRLDPRAGADGLCRAALVNPKLAGGLALVLEWPKKTLPYLTQWKMMGQGTYVLGIEPCNAPLLARAELRRRGLMPELGPGESFETSLALRVAVGAEEIRDLHAGRQGQGHGWNRRERRERGARRRRGRENN